MSYATQENELRFGGGMLFVWLYCNEIILRYYGVCRCFSVSYQVGEVIRNYKQTVFDIGFLCL